MEPAPHGEFLIMVDHENDGQVDQLLNKNIAGAAQFMVHGKYLWDLR